MALLGEVDFHPAFPFLISDVLNDFFPDPDELDMDLTPEIARRAGGSLENPERNPHCGSVRTVFDLVVYFNAQPKLHET